MKILMKIKNYHVLLASILMIIIPLNIFAILSEYDISSNIIQTNCSICLFFGFVFGFISLFRIGDDGLKDLFFNLGE